MENYKILGVDENSSMEEIRQAYEDKVSKIKEDVQDERRAKAFIKVFDKAFEEIKAEKEKIQNQQTIIINDKNYLKDYLKNDNIDEYKDFSEYNEVSSENKPKKKSSSRNTTIKKQNSNRNKVSKYKKSDSKKEKNNSKRDRRKEKENLSEESSIINLFLKVLLVPIIVILTIVIFLCKVINLISWIATKIIIIGSIAVASIHGYQIYIGQPINYEIFALCAIAFLVSLFLPSILKIVPAVLEKINNKLKDFAF